MRSRTSFASRLTILYATDLQLLYHLRVVGDTSIKRLLFESRCLALAAAPPFACNEGVWNLLLQLQQLALHTLIKITIKVMIRDET